MQVNKSLSSLRGFLIRPGNHWAAPILCVFAVLGFGAVALGAVLLGGTSWLIRTALVLGGLGVLGVGADIGITRVVKKPVNMTLLLALIWLTVVGFLAVFADILPFAESLDPSKTLFGPTLTPPDLFSSHPLGTDRHGLDILGGLARGARVSLTVGLGATAIGGLLGVVVGVAAGYFRGRFDAVVSLMIDSMLAFPPLILLIAVVAVLQPTIPVVTLSLALLTIPSFVRIGRANTIALAPREFILTARAMGATRRRIIGRELFPNVFWPLVSYSMVVVAAMIVAEASLSYLGLSIQRPTPTWGNMIAAGQDSIQDFPHLVLVPGVTMFLTVLSLNSVGERMRSRFSNAGRNN